MNKQILNVTFTLFVMQSVTSCSLVEFSGKMTRKTGEAMTEYSEKHDGFIGRVAGFGGNVNTSVGGAVEKAAGGDPEAQQHTQTVTHAQKRLSELGYDPGPADGTVSIKTKSAIAAYQQSNGLTVTESLDQGTLRSLGVESSK